MLAFMTAPRRSRSALEAGGIPAADFRTTLLAADFFGIPSPLGRCRGPCADDSGDLGVLYRSVGPGNDQHNTTVIRVRGRGHVPILAGAVLGVVLLDVEPIPILVRENESSIIKGDAVFFF